MEDALENLRRKAEEVTELRIQLGAAESKREADLSVESLKSQILVESMQSEIKWREKLFRTELHSMQKRLDSTRLEKLKIQVYYFEAFRMIFLSKIYSIRNQNLNFIA